MLDGGGNLLGCRVKNDDALLRAESTLVYHRIWSFKSLDKLPVSIGSDDRIVLAELDECSGVVQERIRVILGLLDSVAVPEEYRASPWLL